MKTIELTDQQIETLKELLQSTSQENFISKTYRAIIDGIAVKLNQA